MALTWALAISSSAVPDSTGQAAYGALCAPYSLSRRTTESAHMLKQFFLIVVFLFSTGAQARGVYQEPQDFLTDTFDGAPPEARVLWLTGERKAGVSKILGHPYPSLRVRYWKREERSAWILEEIGKDKPITIGIVVEKGALEQIKVLVFRESRGWEIRHPFFTEQFTDARLGSDLALDRHIDGISGATLSVRAMKKLAALALYLDAELRKTDVTPSP